MSRIRSAVLILFLLAVVLSPLSLMGQKSRLLPVPPLVVKPTLSSVTLSIAAGVDPLYCYVRYREDLPRSLEWRRSEQVYVPSGGTAELLIASLRPDGKYRYEIYAGTGKDQKFSMEFEGRFRTQRSSGPFSFVMFSDSHLTPFNPERLQVLRSVAASALSRKPDLGLMLGDNIQTFISHGGPLGDKSQGVLLYRILRQGISDIGAYVPLYIVNGNWEGENGWHTQEQREWAREAREAYMPGPDNTTYPEGGSPNQDHYAFTWGNALFVVLNATGYTKTDHTLGSPIGRADDWTLGDQQKAWLEKTLAASKARWKFIAIHHTVGGNGGDDENSRYGRGGGRAAKVGEQALIHQWMRQYGVQAFFYGHDHVFTDIEVDGIHYACVGSAGAPWKFGTEETGYSRYSRESGYAFVEVGADSTKVSYVKPDATGGPGTVAASFVIK